MKSKIYFVLLKMYKVIKLKSMCPKKPSKVCASPWKHFINTSGGNTKITGNYFMIEISFGNIVKSCVSIIWFFNGGKKCFIKKKNK